MKLVYRLGLLALLMGGALAIQAQSPSSFPSYTTGPKPPAQWVVKLAPLSLIDPSNTIQFAVERLISEQQTVQVEFGYGWQQINLWRIASILNSRYSNYETWRGRAEWRYYWHRNPAPIGAYMALEGLYKQENAFENSTVGIGPTDAGQYQYYRLYSLPISKHVWAINLKVGRQFSFSTNNRFVADFYGGLGIRNNSIQQPDRPDGFSYYQPRGALLDPFSSNSLSFLSISYGVKIGYSF